MRVMHHTGTAVSLTLLLAYPILASVDSYSLTVGGERLEYVRQVDRGYVVKLRGEVGLVHALAGLSALDVGNARPVRGSDRRGVWAVENEGPGGRNEQAIRSLRAAGQVAYAAPLFSSNGATVGIIPEIVVRIEPGIGIAELQKVCRTAGCTIKRRMEFTQHEYLLDVLGADAGAVFEAIDELSAAPFVEWAAPNIVFKPRFGAHVGLPDTSGAEYGNAPGFGVASEGSGVVPDDEYFPNLWHLHNTGQSGGTPGADIRAPEAWEITTGDPNIVVYVLDNGIDLGHVDLVDNLVAGYDFWDEDDLAEPGPHLMWGSDPHGTACAGLVAARGNNGSGVVGVTWDCKIMPGRVNVDEEMPVSEADIATALRWGASNGADILCNSWGFYGPLPLIHAAIIDTTKPGGIGRGGKGCVVVFGAGNNTSFIWWPGVYPEVITVGATTRTDLRASFSCRGPELDVAAPGKDVWTTDITGPLGYSFYGLISPADYSRSFSGTSAATPVAAGVAALILSVEPNLTPEEVRHYLERSVEDLGEPGWDEHYGWGRVDARASLDMVLAKRADLNGDWQVDGRDRDILVAAIEANDVSPDIAPAAKRDGVVDVQDLELLTRYGGTVIPEPGLVAHWRFDEVEGPTVRESIGRRDGIAHGDPAWRPQAGVAGGALEFDGIDDYVSTAYEPNLAMGPFSVFLWVKGGMPGQVVLSQQASVNWLIADITRGALRTELIVGDPLGQFLSPEAIISDGNWHRVEFAWDGSGGRLYVDDVIVAEGVQDGPTGSNGMLLIGCDKDMTPGRFWSGLIDDVRVYDRAVIP